MEWPALVSGVETTFWIHIAHREPNYNLISPGPDTVVVGHPANRPFSDTPLPVSCVALLFSESVRIHDYAFINQISDISHPVVACSLAQTPGATAA